MTQELLSKLSGGISPKRPTHFALLAASLIIGATLIGLLFRALGFPETNIVITYILAVLLAARFTPGYRWGIAAAFVSTFTYNFFFTIPLYSFAVSDSSHIITFAIMTITASITSALTSKAKASEEEARRREAEVLMLYSFTNRLSNAFTPHEIAGVAVNTIHSFWGWQAACLCFNGEGRPEDSYIQQVGEDTPIWRRTEEPQRVMNEMLQLRRACLTGEEFFDWPVYSTKKLLAVIRIPAPDARTMTDDQRQALHSVIKGVALAMDRYGSDKPDLRFGLPIVDVTDIAAGCGFSVFRSVAKAGGVVRAINVPGGNDLTRTAIEELTALAQRSGAKGMAWIALRPDGEIYSILTKFMTQEEIEAIVRRVGAKPGDFILFCADRLAAVRRVLGVLRLALGDMLSMRKKDDYRFLIVTDFPQFEYSEEEGRFVAMHHPFTMPYEEDIPYLLTQPERVRAQAYDVVLNGVELGSGSMRIHRRDVQEKMFEALGFSKEEAERRFGFMMGAFQYGTPPHGGFAFGLDRLVMLMLGASSLREVVAFPKLKDASCPMTSAPDFVDEEQLKVLSIGGGKAEEDPQEKAQRRARTEAFDVDAVARLARLELNEKEREAFQSEFGGIIAFADSLSALDLTGVEPTAHVAPIRNVFRPDEAAPSFERAQLLQNAPSAAHGMFAVPKTVE